MEILSRLIEEQTSYDQLKSKFDNLYNTLGKIEEITKDSLEFGEDHYKKLKTLLPTRGDKEDNLIFSIGNTNLFCTFFQYETIYGALCFGYYYKENGKSKCRITDHLFFHKSGNVYKDLENNQNLLHSINDSNFLGYFYELIFNSYQKHSEWLKGHIAPRDGS